VSAVCVESLNMALSDYLSAGTVGDAYMYADVPQLGKGQFGVVRAATNRATGAAVAVKEVRKTAMAPAALMNELAVMARVRDRIHAAGGATGEALMRYEASFDSLRAWYIVLG
jgi:serine/threonine protein kinase